MHERLRRAGDPHRLADRSPRRAIATIRRRGEAQSGASGHRARSCRPAAPDERGRADRRGARRAPRRAWRPGFTVLCCDNLPHNGALVRGLVQRFAAARDRVLARWIADHASFPSTMVDRIVPATTEADIADNDAVLGLHDAAPVVHEPFKQWVIEDDFVGRPSGMGARRRAVRRRCRAVRGDEAAAAQRQPLGVRLSRAISPVTSSSIRWPRGPSSSRYMRRLMDEVIADAARCRPASISPRIGTALVERFGNPALPHRTQQIAMDGSQKLPQRLLGTVRDNLAAGRSIELARARRGGVDALRERPRRVGPRDQGVRPAVRRVRTDRGPAARRPGRARSRDARASRRSSATIFPPIRALRAASRRASRSFSRQGAARTVARAVQEAR